MGHEITLHLAAGIILHMRALPNGIDVTAFARKNLQQRVVYAAIVGADGVRVQDGDKIFFGRDNAFIPAKPTEAAAVVAFAELAKVNG